MIRSLSIRFISNPTNPPQPGEVARHTASLRFNTWTEEEHWWKPQRVIDDFEITPIPIHHGDDYTDMLGEITDPHSRVRIL